MSDHYGRIGFPSLFPVNRLPEKPFKDFREAIVPSWRGREAEHMFRLNFHKSSAEMGRAQMMAFIKDCEAVGFKCLFGELSPTECLDHTNGNVIGRGFDFTLIALKDPDTEVWHDRGHLSPPLVH